MIPWKTILPSLRCRISLTKNSSQDFAKEGYDVAFQQLTKWQVKLVNSKDTSPYKKSEAGSHAGSRPTASPLSCGETQDSCQS